MAPSRYAFYPRPTKTIQDYGKSHGKALKQAALKIVNQLSQTMQRGGNTRGEVSRLLYQKIVSDNDCEKTRDLLARNLIGIMEGMLPPTAGILRGVIYEWLDKDNQTLWRHQAALLRETKGPPRATFEEANRVLRYAVEEAMCKRPAPDLLYRTAVQEDDLNGTKINPGDLVILGSVSATQAALDEGDPDITPIFGGQRKAACQSGDAPVHACPAQEMVMATILGILAAFLASGRIEALPSALIVKISGYKIAQ
jgi:cytochrome P450